MVIDLISGYQDNTDDLMKYFYIPGQTIVADEVKHPESDGYVLMCVPGYHENFKATASSTYSAKGYKFSTDGLTDADYRTGWCGENPTGDSITYEFDDTVGLRKLILVNGNVKDEASYNAFGKVKKLRLDFDGGFQEAEIEQVSYSDFINQGVAYILDFQKIINTKTLKITVLETIPGNANELPCISDIVVGFKMKAFVTRKSTGEKISTTLLRKALSDGDADLARDLCGRDYYYSGSVVQGKMLGRTMGFPTANIVVPEEKFVVRRGVYVSRIRLGQRVLYGVTNIGRRPTLEDAVNDVVETYIFDFDEDIYGAKISVELMHFLRPEEHYSSKDELVAAVEQNKQQADEYIKNLN